MPDTGKVIADTATKQVQTPIWLLLVFMLGTAGLGAGGAGALAPTGQLEDIKIELRAIRQSLAEGQAADAGVRAATDALEKRVDKLEDDMRGKTNASTTGELTKRLDRMEGRMDRMEGK